MGRRKPKLDTDACYQAFLRITQSLNSPLPLRQSLHLALRSAAKAIGVSGCGLVILDTTKKHLLHVSSYGLGDWYVKKGLLDVDKSIGDVLSGQPVTIIDAAIDPKVQYGDEAKRAGITSMLGMPLKSKDEVIGALRAYSHEKKKFNRAEIAFFSAVADACAVAVENTRMAERLDECRGQPMGSVVASNESQAAASELRRPAQFAHPSEEEFARLLDFYRIDWLYEPRSFPLQWEQDRVAEMFTPDFYLPDLDQYIELTTMKQSLATDKNRKVRLLRQLYPGVKVMLLNRSGFARLLAKYGIGLRGETKVVRVLISTPQIQRKVKALGRKISRDYAGKNLVLVGVLKGVIPFMSDLMRSISLPLATDFMAVSYYSEESPQVRITKDLDIDISGQDVLMVEDIVDTGLTLHYVLEHLRERKPASLRVCAMLDKRVRRLTEVDLDYVGFEIPDEFVVGYGLDYIGEYRNLPFVGVLSPKEKSDTEDETPRQDHKTKGPE
ncbi:MAG: hypoxanthine phosphoribosyltransferase [Dehalococcoidia bacterium]|nr:hypoxanthine phosphoribosyltransferase [Dehalococcoidia bacterium]